MSGPAKPRILITNDDGINAPGIRALINELARQGFADLFVSAPDGERSAQSHAITLGRYMRCAEPPTTAQLLAVQA